MISILYILQLLIIVLMNDILLGAESYRPMGKPFISCSVQPDRAEGLHGGYS